MEDGWIKVPLRRLMELASPQRAPETRWRWVKLETEAGRKLALQRPDGRRFLFRLRGQAAIKRIEND
jgi:hypothetical protein